MKSSAFITSLVLFACGLMGRVEATDTPPNVVLILADDLGWSDLACYGSDLHETPHLDRLARDGMKFTQNYAACTVCSPTRSALMTGKYPARTHITDWIPGRMPENPKLLVPAWTKFLPLEEITLAEVFKSAGYATASIGKWHLGEGEHVPEKQGFDVNVAGTNAGSPPSYLAPWKIPTLPEGKDGDYLTDRLGDVAADFIQRSKDRPFFLYLPHFAVHTPTQGRADLVAKYQAKLKPGLAHTNAEYAAMMESLDSAVGRVLTTLDELKLTDRTIVVFTSDNGGRVPTTLNKTLRVGKGSAYEGGLRVPLIVRWPGATKPGSVSDTPVITMDLFPSLIEMTGMKAVASTSTTGASGRDGISLVPLLRGNGSLQRTELFWHYPHHQHYQLGGSMPFGVVRSGDFKLIEFYNDMHVELYHLRDDIGEQHDLTAAQPEKAAEVRARLHAWRKEVGAQMPLPNPNYDPTKPEHIPPPTKVKKNKATSNGVLIPPTKGTVTPPYPPSPVIAGIEWAPKESIIRKAKDGDNWPLTWADDDALYTTWGDGTGFKPKVEKKLSMGFARITGGPEQSNGVNVRSRAEQLGQGREGKKGWGMLCVDGVLNLWLGHADNQGAMAQLAWSRDHAKTWTFADWKFAEFGMMGFVNFGKDYAGARDEFVYAYSHDEPRADTPADHFILMRALKDKLTQRESWEFLAKLDATGQPVWTRDIKERGAVFQHPGACLRSAMTYCAALKRYLWWQQLPQPPGVTNDRGDTRFSGGFAIYDAPEPWGPWTTAFFTEQWDTGPGEHADFPAKWMSADAKTLCLVFSGDDSFSVREAKVRLR